MQISIMNIHTFYSQETKLQISDSIRETENITANRRPRGRESPPADPRLGMPVLTRQGQILPTRQRRFKTRSRTYPHPRLFPVLVSVLFPHPKAFLQIYSAFVCN